MAHTLEQLGTAALIGIVLTFLGGLLFPFLYLLAEIGIPGLGRLVRGVSGMVFARFIGQWALGMHVVGTVLLLFVFAPYQNLRTTGIAIGSLTCLALYWLRRISAARAARL